MIIQAVTHIDLTCKDICHSEQLDGFNKSWSEFGIFVKKNNFFKDDDLMIMTLKLSEEFLSGNQFKYLVQC